MSSGYQPKGGPDSPPKNAPNMGSAGKKRMKLYVDQPEGDGCSGKAFAIYNEAGEKLIGVTSASVHHEVNDAARIDLSLVVNGHDIVFGKPPALKQEQSLSINFQGETFGRDQVRRLIDAINDAVAGGANLKLD